MTPADIISVIGIAATLLGVSINAFVALRVASVNTKVKDVAAGVKAAADNIEKVHVAVNSERTAMVAKLEELLGKNFKLEGAAEERKKVDDTAATFEAGRKEGADSKGV